MEMEVSGQPPTSRQEAEFYGTPCSGSGFAVEDDRLHDRQVMRLDPGGMVEFPMGDSPRTLVSLSVEIKSAGPDDLRAVWGGNEVRLVAWPFLPGKWTKGMVLLPPTQKESFGFVNRGEHPLWFADIGIREWEDGGPRYEATNLSILVLYKEEALLRNLLQILRKIGEANGDGLQVFISQERMTRV